MVLERKHLTPRYTALYGGYSKIPYIIGGGNVRCRKTEGYIIPVQDESDWQ